MKRIFILLFLTELVCLPSSRVFAHMCHDPFRPREHLVFEPEKDLIRIEDEGEFRMYVENTFRSTLRDVRLFAESPAFDIEIEPRVLGRLVPGERTFFLVKIKLKEGLESGNYPLGISVGARSAELRPSIEEMDVVVDKKIPELQIKPEEIKREEIVPAEEKVVPLKKKPEPPVEEVKLPEKVVEPLKEEISRPLEEGRTQEVGEVVVKVERLPFWKKPYFYIILILLLLSILIWRKIK